MLNIQQLEELVKRINLSDSLYLIPDEEDKKLFLSDEEHYKLICAISKLLNNKRLNPLYDIGTYKGLSALALAGDNDLVISYDIFYNVKIIRPANIEFRIGNFYNDRLIEKSSFIVFDIDPHGGLHERRFYQELKNSEFKGLVLFDDIHLNDEMESFWKDISHKKHDLTHIGHWSGSGLVDFS